MAAIENHVTNGHNANGMNGNGKKAQNPKKFLFVSMESLSGDLAWQIKKEGHEVKCYVKSEDDKDVYEGILEKIDNWREYKEWADVIVFDDVGFGEIAESLRKQGKLVVGGSIYTDKLEEDREFGQKEMKRVGMNILPHWDFSEFDEAIEFIKQNPARYVFKPSGSVSSESKGILFLSHDEDGKDLIEILEQNKKTWAKKIKRFQLQKMAVGVEVAVGAFFNGKDFTYPINVNFEHKKLFPGDIGPFTGEMGCYDEETEVLTKHGWKFFKDLSETDIICTLNPSTQEIEFQKPSAIVQFAHHKNLISIKNNTLDIMVTPDHNMYVNSQCDARNKKSNFKFVKARDLQHQSVIKRTGIWRGIEQKIFFLPSVAIGHYEGRQVALHQTDELKIPMDSWLAFMGIWLSDGCASQGHSVTIAQKIPGKTQKIQELLEILPFKFSKNNDAFNIYNKQLHSYLSQFGKAPQKHIPEFIKEMSQRQIKIFLEWFTLGDGTIMKNGFRIFYTSSKKLADDLQELLLRIGRIGTIKTRQPRGRIWIKDHFADSSRIQYEVIERVRKIDSWIDKRDIKKIDYNGKVYCAEVKNHIMYVRRNGKPYWCGNTLVYWSPPNEIFRSTLLKIKQDIINSGYVGYIDINCIANAKGIYPLEWTCRFGYPIISIQIEGVTSEWGEFLYNLAKGDDMELKTKKGFQVGVCVVVPPFPYKDKNESYIYKDLSIVFKKNSMDGMHLGDIKLVNGAWSIAGMTGYVMVMTGSGQTVEDARKQVYARLKNIILQNMYYRTDIGVKWSSDSDKLQTWGYLY